MSPVLAIGCFLVIEGQLYPKSGLIRTSVRVTRLCDDDINSVRVECDAHPHVKQITRQDDGSLVFRTTDFQPKKSDSEFLGDFIKDTMPLTIVGQPTRSAA